MFHAWNESIARCWFAGLLCVVAPAAAVAGIPTSDLTIELEPIATGLTAPLGVTHAGDGSGRLFIVEQSGQIRIVENGALLPTPFLDIASKLPSLSMGFDERGLLGLAFHPDYPINGRFFIRYSVPRTGDPTEPCFGTSRGCHSEVLAEYSVSAGNPNLADPASEIILFSVDEPQFNHDAGDVAFGPDGFLYFSLGDGGGAHDGLAAMPPLHGPIGNGQNTMTALGSMIRIDVDSPPTPPLAYAIPPDNPFVGQTGLDEIYAWGFRNPYKFSFDDGPGGTGDLILADVGQNLFEEINIVVNGGNYGWVVREGLHCFDPLNPLIPPAMCPSVGPMNEPLIDPIVEYSHPGSGFIPEGGITVIGGFVYRGPRNPGLTGTYIFGDFAQVFFAPSGSLYHMVEPVPGSFEIRQFKIGVDDRPYDLFLKGFGEDEDGEVYTCGSTALAPFGTGGVVHRIVHVQDVPMDIRPGACPNPFNRTSNGVLPIALVGTAGFDVSNVDISTVSLTRSGLEERFGANLNGGQQNPPVETDAGGVATFVLSADGSVLTYSITLQGLDLDGNQTPGNSLDDVVGMHIHNAPAGMNAGVVFGMISPGQDPDIVIDPVAGTISGTWDAGDPSSQPLAAMLGELRAGNLYLNVHTPANPSGEVRGQIEAVAGSVAPLSGPPGPSARITDVATPFTGPTCGCHSQGGDGIDDLLLKFRSSEVTAALQLASMPGGALVELTITGNLLDGTPFAASDCVRLVPPGSPPGMMSVRSNAAGVWIEASPPDLALDGGGFAGFDRTYPQSTVVTLQAPLGHEGLVFAGWRLDGSPLSGRSRLIRVVVGELSLVEALYRTPPAKTLPSRETEGKRDAEADDGDG